MLMASAAHASDLSAPLTVRSAHPREQEMVAALLAEEGLPTQGVVTRGTCWLMAERGGWLLGVAGVEFGSSGACLLRTVTVRRGTRQQGLGMRLAQAAMDEASRRACDRMYLLSADGARVLQRLGFRPVSVEEVQAALPEAPLMRLYHHFGVPPGTTAWRCEL